MGPGDVVQLRCGGPKMVISHRAEPVPRLSYIDYTEPRPQPGWMCLWTVQNALRSAVIPDEALKVIESADLSRAETA